MRILLVSQMYPSAAEPDLGVFVQGMERALAARGHELERAVLDHRGGGRRRYLSLAADALRKARRFRPDVVYAHFLVPTGLLAGLVSRAPLVVTAHGQDVANIGSVPGVRALTRLVARRAHSIIAVSDYLRGLLETRVPEARRKLEVIDMGVDLERFRALPRAAGRGPSFLCVGSLSERKNVVRLADAFAQLREGTLTFVGEGPLREQLEGRPKIHLAGALPHHEIPDWLSRADVLCQPSLVEPFGLATLEAMASARSVVATRVGGPSEFVTEEAGVLVDPLDVDALADALRRAAGLPCPNPAARDAASRHDLREQAARIEAVLERAARRERR